MTAWRVCVQTEPTSETVKPDAARPGSLVRRVESIAKPAEPPRWLGRFLCWEFGKEGRVVIFQGKVARPAERQCEQAGTMPPEAVRIVRMKQIWRSSTRAGTREEWPFAISSSRTWWSAG